MTFPSVPLLAKTISQIQKCISENSKYFKSLIPLFCELRTPMNKSNVDTISKDFRSLLSSLVLKIETLTLVSRLSSNVVTSRSKSLLNRLQMIERNMSKLEQDVEDFENFLDNEQRSLNSLRSLSAIVNAQNQDIQKLKTQIPGYIRRDQQSKIMILPKPDNLSVQLRAGESYNAVTVFEFESVAKSTRGRLSLNQINEALECFADLLTKRRKVSFISFQSIVSLNWLSGK